MGKAVRPGGSLVLTAMDKGSLVRRCSPRLDDDLFIDGKLVAVDEPHDCGFRGHQGGRAGRRESQGAPLLVPRSCVRLCSQLRSCDRSQRTRPTTRRELRPRSRSRRRQKMIMVTIVRYTNPPEPGSVSVAHTFRRRLPGSNYRSVTLTYCVITMCGSVETRSG